MAKSFSILLLSCAAFAQPQSFDVYTYEVPAGYSAQSSAAAVVWSKIDQKKRSYCQIGFYRAQPSAATAAQDMENEWKAVVLHQFKVSGAASNKELPLPNAPTSLVRGSEATDGNGNKALPSLFVLRFPGRYVGVLYNASNADAFQGCQDDVTRAVLSVKLNDRLPAPAPQSQQSQPVAPTRGGLAGAWERVIASQTATKYNMFTKQWEYDPVAAMNQFRQTHRFRFETNGRYTYELIADSYNRSERSMVVEQGAYTVANGVIQFQPQSTREGKGPRTQDPPLTAKTPPAPHARRFLIGEHPQYKDSAGLQLQTGDGGFETYKPAQ